MNKIQLTIFDDHPIVADGVMSFLSKYQDEISVVSISNAKEDLINQLKLTTPEILLMDVVAPDVNGLDLFSEVLTNFPFVKILAYTSLKSPILVENLLSMGVKGFVNKMQSTEDLYKAIKDVHYDIISVPEKYKYLTSRYREPVKNNLTPREMDILHLIAREYTTQEIADNLNLSAKTIENHKINIFKKFQVKNSAGLILAATRLGLVS